MSKSTQAIPPGQENLIPHLVCAPCSEAIEFYKKAFGAEEVSRMPAPEPGHVLKSPDEVREATGEVPSVQAIQTTNDSRRRALRQTIEVDDAAIHTLVLGHDVEDRLVPQFRAMMKSLQPYIELWKATRESVVPAMALPGWRRRSSSI